MFNDLSNSAYFGIRIMPEPENTTSFLENTEWNLANLPPKGHKDVSYFAWELFETARLERDRQNLRDRWKANDKLRRGDPSLGKVRNKKRKGGFTPVNLYFANVERTVSVVTSQDPVAEVIDLTGQSKKEEPASDLLLTAKLRKWWKDTNQKKKLKTSALNMETYGITVEHPFWDPDNKKPNVSVVDCYSFFPAPGNYEDISADCPYICNAYPELIEGVEAQFHVEGVLADDIYNILGEDREEHRIMAADNELQPSYTGSFSPVVQRSEKGTDIRQNRALVVQVWIRDYTRETITVDVKTDELDEQGNPRIAQEKVEQFKYPGNIRVITITNMGHLLLADTPNPNINPKLPREIAQKTHAWNHIPFYKSNSYEDTTSIWGFAASEQVEDLVSKISEIYTRLTAFALRVMTPALVCPQGIGITKDMLESRITKPNLVIMPDREIHPGTIYYLEIPRLPADFFKIVDMLTNVFDRIYAIEEADRGVTPTRIVAAAAIRALQERNAILMQSKRESVEFLVEQRGQWAISFLQNFSAVLESVDVQGEVSEFVGINFAGRQFSYTVESGSMMPQTSVWVADQAERYYKDGAIDRQALLETVNFPGWKEIIERVGETQLDQALQILIQAGLPEEDAIMLKQVLMETQGGPGNRPPANKKKEGEKGSTSPKQQPAGA